MTTSKSPLPPLPLDEESLKDLPPQNKQERPRQTPTNRMWVLTKTLFQNQRSFRSGKSSWKKYVGRGTLYLILGLSFCPMLFYLGLTSLTFFNLGLGQPYLTMYFIVQCLFALMTIVFAFPSVFYFSTDNKTLLSLPFQASEIVGAKTIVVLSTQTAIMIGGALPLLVGYGLSQAFTWLGFLYLLGSEILIHLTLFVVVGTLCLFVFSCLPRVVNKDRFTLITSIVALCFSLSIAIFSPRMVEVETLDSTSLSTLLVQMENSLGFLSRIFFSIPFASRAIMGNDFWDFCLEVILFGIGLLIYWWAANRFYLDSAMAADWASASKKKMNVGQIQRKSSWKSYLKNEFVLLLKTPAYVFNIVGSGFLLPLVLGITLGMQRGELQELIQTDLIVNGQLVLFDLPLWSVALSLGLFSSLFMSGVSGTSATAISRMGLSGVAWMKEIPMEISKQVLLKCVPGIVLSILSTQLLVIIFHMFFPYPLWLDGCFLLGNVLASVFNNFLGIITDLLHPKLVWDNETQAVKNNFNTIIDLGISTLLLLVLLVTYWLFSFSTATLFVSFFFVVAIGILYWLIKRKASDWLLKDR